MAKILKNGGNFLILDEPTNDLDLPTLRLLEEALVAFEGSVLVISHDRYFLNRVARAILCVENGACRLYEGNYDAFIEARRRQAAGDRQQAPPFAPPEASKPERKASYEQAKKADRERERRARRFARIEEEIVSTEDQILVLDEEMSRPEVARDWGRLGELSRKRQDLKAAVDRLYEAWAELEGGTQEAKSCQSTQES